MCVRVYRAMEQRDPSWTVQLCVWSMATPQEYEACELPKRQWSCNTLVAGVPLLSQHAMASRDVQPNLASMIEAL